MRELPIELIGAFGDSDADDDPFAIEFGEANEFSDGEEVGRGGIKWKTKKKKKKKKKKNKKMENQKKRINGKSKKE